MAFYKKAYNKKTDVYYPRAITIGTAINTDQIAETLADRSTVTKTDVKAVLTEWQMSCHNTWHKAKA